MIPVQFITHANERYSYLQSALLALEGGCKWIQLRMKDATDEEVSSVAKELKKHCTNHDAILIIDDRVQLAKQLEVDGVHLGKEDMPIEEARQILGEGFIIGGTANTMDDVRRLCQAHVDYIGLGPFRYTATKKNLSPILGLDGLAHIVRTMQNEGLRKPVCAIGGIGLEDVPSIMGTGVNGIAVSGAILQSDSPSAMMRSFLEAPAK